MKTGLTLEQLAAEITRQQSAKEIMWSIPAIFVWKAMAPT